MWQIKRNVLASILLAAQNCYPDEFLALLGGDAKKKIIDELVVIPGSEYGEDFSTLRTDLVPFDESLIGSVHSHACKRIQASPEDLLSFPRMGFVHLIAGLPFDFNSVKLFDAQGRALEYKLI